MSPAVKNGILLVIVVGALGVAGYLFFTGGDEKTLYPDEEQTKTHWMCDQEGCDYLVALTAREKNEWVESEDKVRRDKRFSAKQTVFWCPECKKFTVVRAKYDRRAGVYYFPKDSQGRSCLSPTMQERRKNR